MSPIMRICTRCQRLAPELEIRTPPAGKCAACGPIYEREKRQRRRATSAATRTRDSTAWQKIRAIARNRDGGCTQRHTGNCDGDLAVHHITPLERGGTNALDNLTTLCRAHHEQAEAGFLESARSHPTPHFGEIESGNGLNKPDPSSPVEPSAEPRNTTREVVPVRLSADERGRIAAAAELGELTVSGFIRQSALVAAADSEVPTPERPEPPPRAPVVLDTENEERPAGRWVDGEWVPRR